MRIEELRQYLDRTRQELLDLAGKVDPARAGTRSGPDRWAPAEIIEHLGKVERMIGRLLERMLRQAGQAAVGEAVDFQVAPKLLDFQAEKGMEVDPARGTEPEGGSNYVELLTLLKDRRVATLASIEAAATHELGGIRQAHGYFGELGFYEWAWFLGKHEEGHTWQFRRNAGL